MCSTKPITISMPCRIARCDTLLFSCHINSESKPLSTPNGSVNFASCNEQIIVKDNLINKELEDR